jgi:predicted ATP-dependent serine protease
LEQAVSAYAHGSGKRRSYVCTNCHRAQAEWTGFCVGCGQWDSYRSGVEIGVQ